MRRFWRSKYLPPCRRGWYETKDPELGVKYRAWGCGQWWIKLADGWAADLVARYQWRGPRITLDDWDKGVRP